MIILLFRMCKAKRVVGSMRGRCSERWNITSPWFLISSPHTLLWNQSSLLFSSQENLVHPASATNKDSPLLTKETLLVYICPFSTFNTRPSRCYLPAPAPSAVHRRRQSSTVHTVQTDPPNTHTVPQICLDSSTSRLTPPPPGNPFTG